MSFSEILKGIESNFGNAPRCKILVLSMLTSLIINLPVKNISTSKMFFEAVGLEHDAEMSDGGAAAFKLAENIRVVLLEEPHFKEITGNEVAETSLVSEVLLSVGLPDGDGVDSMLTKALAAGGKELHDPKDFGWIYGRSFSDLDGHQWNVFFMDESLKPS